MPNDSLQSKPLPFTPSVGNSGGSLSNSSLPSKPGQDLQNRQISKTGSPSQQYQSLRNSRSMPASRGSVFENIDIDQIGQGRLLTEGSYYNHLGAKKNLGLKGQLGRLKRSGRFSSTKNLSMNNVEQIHNLIADRMKGKAVSSQTIISRQDKLAILKESRKLVKTEGSKFTRQDREDLKRIVESLRQQYKDKALHRGDLD